MDARTREDDRRTPDPVLELLLDPERLSGLLRTSVRATRVRPKPGVSHTAALLGPDGRVVGWVQALIGPARPKAAKARARAERYGHGALIGSLPLPQWDAELVWGGIATDPELGSPLRRSGLDLAAPDLVLLRYNPLRRLVVRSGSQVVRVTAQPHARRMSAVARALAAQELPVVAPLDRHQGGPAGQVDPGVVEGQVDSAAGQVDPGVVEGQVDPAEGQVDPGAVEGRVRVSRRVSVWPWVEGTDLAQADVASARAAGALAARLHRASLPGPTATTTGSTAPSAGAPVPPELLESLELPERGWEDLLAAARRSLTLLHAVAPEVAHPARLALAGLPERGPDGDPTTTGHRVGAEGSVRVLLHGDLSLDQFLLGDDGVVRLTDLDRACLGPVELDLASVRAAQILHEVRRRHESGGAADPVQGDGAPAWEAFVDGYGWAPLSGAWVSAALLARVTEPWRSQAPGWREQTRDVGQLALDHVTGTLLPGGRWIGRSDPGGALARHPDPAGPPGTSPDNGSSPGNGTSPDPGGSAGPTTSRPAWRVPREIQSHTEVDGPGGARVTVTIGRAWPAGVRDGRARVAVEGLDERGRLRAGTLGTGGEVTLLPHGEDPRLPALAAEARTGSLLVHRAGRRAVVHRADGYLKVVRPGRAEGLVEASVRGAAVARAAGFAAADVLDSTDGAVLTTTLHGIPVQRLASDGSWPDVWAAWTAGWERWQQLPTVGLTAHTPAHEAQVLRTWAERVGALDLLAGTPWPERLARTAQELDRSPRLDLTVAHRDLHDGQLLWDGERVGVVDLDTVCRAEPALDLANLAVHAGLRRAQGMWSVTAAERVEEAVEEVARESGVPGRRLELARRATVARLAAVYCLRPRWREVVLAWADQQWDADPRWSA
ncbi:hypothetical protein [Serinicoccus chungangensis]|uniref:hypothetical protein n=1 Tax=Serinicoccus chungangensis TaxID=767452 RepID=UPI0011184CB0|nr:hypothetical protein [Serinicoccus chungangensis]